MAGNLEIKNAQGKKVTLQNPDTNGSDIVIDLADVASKANVALKANTADLKEIGVGQTWQDVKASRSVGVTYTNSTGKPIVVSITGSSSNTVSGASCSAKIVVNGIILVGSSAVYNASYPTASAIAIVPNGATYLVDLLSGAQNTFWSELR